MAVLTLVSAFWKPGAHKLFFFLYVFMQAAIFTSPSDYGNYWYILVNNKIWIIYTISCSGNLGAELIATIALLGYLQFYI